MREQGVGDEILYGSMYGDLLEKNQNVTFECDERLIPLFQYSLNQNHKDKFINLGSISNYEDKLKNYDFVLYAGSLGKFFRNDINLFPKTSYLDVEQEFINETKNKVSFELHAGSLLVMKDETQQFWKHNISKTKKVTTPRISLTFRQLIKP